MPWNDNANPGPWGSPPSSHDDEAQAGRRPPAPPPPPAPAPPGLDFGEVLKRARAEWGRLTRGRRAKRLTARLVGLAAAGVAALWILSGFYIVQPYEKAIVTRLGAYDRTDGPGVRFHLPSPIEKVEVVDVGNEQKLVIGGVDASGATGESLMPTGDGNLLAVDAAVQYRVSDPVAWLFQVRDPDSVVRAAAESALREVVGQSGLTAVLGDGRAEIQARARALSQSFLKGAGVTVDAVQIQSAAPPAEVTAAYQDLTRAGQEAQSATDAANATAGKTVGDAQAAAARITEAAGAYQEQVVHEANGEASRFDQIYAQYRRAPAITRERLYIQTMEDVLAHARTVIVGAKGAQIVLAPQTSLPSSQEPSGQTPSPAPAARPAAPGDPS